MSFGTKVWSGVMLSSSASYSSTIELCAHTRTGVHTGCLPCPHGQFRLAGMRLCRRILDCDEMKVIDTRSVTFRHTHGGVQHTGMFIMLDEMLLCHCV